MEDNKLKYPLGNKIHNNNYCSPTVSCIFCLVLLLYVKNASNMDHFLSFYYYA